MAKPVMAHNVYFWLKEGTSKEERLAFEKGLTKLGTVPCLNMYFWGKPADTEERDVIDRSYDYAINSFFVTLEDQETYQSHPIHLEFIKNHNHIWSKVKVFDNLTK